MSYRILLPAICVCIVSVVLMACVREEATHSSPAPETPVRADVALLASAVTPVRLVEAPLPAGFSEPLVLDQALLERVPAYRAVEGSGFRDCFRHISANDIPMTAPVYMPFTVSDDGSIRNTQKMRFLYPDPGLTAPSPGSRVTEVDEAAVDVVSIRTKGLMTDQRITELYNEALAYIRSEHPDLQPQKQIMIMGYNSPFVMPWKRMWGVQIPVSASVNDGSDHAGY